MQRLFTVFRVVGQPIAIAIACAVLLRVAVHAYSIPSDSMSPALRAGDHILVTRSWHEPTRGDVVVFRYPLDPEQLFVKRVVAGPGDHLEIRDGIVRLNGRSLAEPYVVERDALDFSPEIIPPKSFFVLGDRRIDSIDSRTFGLVPREMIVGRARTIFWSSEAAAPYPSAAAHSARGRGNPPGDRGIRWNRVLEPVR
ncbi:MAG TPA: signal peptidase I [Thermoanaerobaculia bacterium]